MNQIYSSIRIHYKKVEQFVRGVSQLVCVCVKDSPVMGVAVFFGIVSPGSELLGVEGLNLHEKLLNTETE